MGCAIFFLKTTFLKIFSGKLGNLGPFLTIKAVILVLLECCGCGRFARSSSRNSCKNGYIYWKESRNLRVLASNDQHLLVQ
jgi:hypothetical protein